MKRTLGIAFSVLLLILAGSAVAAEGHEQEGKLIRLDPDAKSLEIQTSQGDQMEVYWTETTKLEDGLTIPELRIGDKIEVTYLERDGKKWATEIEREKKAPK